MLCLVGLTPLVVPPMLATHAVVSGFCEGRFWSGVWRPAVSWRCLLEKNATLTPGLFLFMGHPCYTYVMSHSHKIRVAVLRGGPSDEYEVSLKTGASVLSSLSLEIYHPQDIVISKDGKWHKGGIETTPHHIFTHADVIFNALHGAYGEDGKLQHLLELHQIPFTGSGSFASALGMNKVLAKDSFKKHGIKTPYFKLVTSEKPLSSSNLVELFKSFPLPFIVKPATSGSSVGVTLVKDFSSFEPAIALALASSDTALIEEYISGVEATVGVIEGYRDHDLYALPPIEIRPKGTSFFDYDAKYKGMSEEIVPGNFSDTHKVELESLARKVHEILGLRHYSRTDFIVTPRRGIFVLEVNTLPGLTNESLIPKALNAVGSSLSHFVDHIVQLALRHK